jgi:hypothetical protein
MNAARYYFLALIVAGGVSLCSAAEDYYHTYVNLLGTNIARNILVDSPLLIDTNNLAPKLGASVINLAETVTNCQIGQVRLGMTMEEVVAGWGKPRKIWPSCFGGARFIYGDVNVIFELGSNSVISVYCMSHSRMPRFAGGLSPSSEQSEFLRVLGAPSAQFGPSPNYWPSSELVYAKSAATLRLGFHDDRLDTLRLDRPGVEHFNGKMIPLRLDRRAGTGDPKQ